MLGIVSKYNVWIADNEANHDDIRIEGSIYCEKGGFGAENNETRPKSGYIHLYGGIVNDKRRPVGLFTEDEGVINGFSKKYRYDKKLMMASPPFYPGTGAFEIVSWYE
jgi:hypothetical protein